ncbi:MAG: UDP-N-acetylmuramate dehydrogenase [Tannerellaceae bacterium]|jgi:UDP-N-acetylmuramate dehydrogenase|nr:UDP-N-acetylmuramate dehydrogenase [Tannerellaceae bacterium]
MRIEEHYSLENHNTFRLPVKARRFMEYANEEELLHMLGDASFRGSDSLHIGSGSNLLFLDHYNGIILHSAIRGVELVEETARTVLLRIGAGEPWDAVVAFAVSMGWYGIENLSGIPGEAGAAAVQNIGAYGVELKDAVETVEARSRRNLQPRTFTREACRYAYRRSRFKEEEESGNPYIVTHLSLRLRKTPCLRLDYAGLEEFITRRYPSVGLSEVREGILSLRKEKLPDPAQCGNAGSFFMNPILSAPHFDALRRQYPAMPFFRAGEEAVKIPAGWLIEQCGFKGKSFGRVGVYEKQALVLVNLGGAGGEEIARLADCIRGEVFGRFGIALTPEVRYIGIRRLPE